MKKKKRERGHSNKDFNSQRILDRELGKAMRDVGLEEEHHGRKGSNQRHDGKPNFRMIKESNALQMELYQSGDLQVMEDFFKCGGCFFRPVQRQISDDGNETVLNLFLKYWEYEPDERKYLIRKKNIKMLLVYFKSGRSLGLQNEALVKDCSFPRDFVLEFIFYCSSSFSQKVRKLLLSRGFAVPLKK